MTEPSKTPRTDALIDDCNSEAGIGGEHDATRHWLLQSRLRVLCRELETALTAAQAENERLREDAERWRYLRGHINYTDEIRGMATNKTAPPLTWNVRCWKHDSNDFVSNTIDAAIDAARNAK